VPVDAAMSAVLRAGTWNIREGIPTGGNGKNWHARLASIIAQADLDVLALQEVPFDRHGHSTILTTITEQTKLRYASGFSLSPSGFSSRNRSGIALASRVPHCVSNQMRLPNPDLRSDRPGVSWVSWDKGMLLIELKVSKLPFWVGSVHCYPFHKFDRKAEDEEFTPIWQALAAAVNHIPGEHIIVAGDFNTERRDLITGMVKKHRLIPAIEGMATHRGRAVDDILHSRQLIRRSFAVTSSLSDHAFCQAEFGIEDVAQ